MVRCSLVLSRSKFAIIHLWNGNNLPEVKEELHRLEEIGVIVKNEEPTEQLASFLQYSGIAI